MKNVLRMAALSAIASVTTLAAHAGTLQTIPGSTVFVNANDPQRNRVVVLHRTSGGKLKRVASVPTGGRGAGPGELLARDPLGSQGAVVLTDDGRWLLVVNSGSNQISAFRVIAGLPQLTSVVDSGGTFPNSIAVNGDDVYVLNAGGETNVVGFQLSPLGQLRRIPDGTRRLLTPSAQVNRQPNPTTTPAQIEFSPDGNFLVVADKNVASPPGLLQVFSVGPNGELSARPVANPTAGAAPFGFAFDRKGHLLVTELTNPSVTSYNLRDDGTIETLSTVLTGRAGICWIDLSRNFIFVSNTAADDLSSLRVDGQGNLTLLRATAAPEPAVTDISVSGDGRWLHVLNQADGRVAVLSIDPTTGALTRTDEIQLFEPFSGAAGIAAL